MISHEHGGVASLGFIIYVNYEGYWAAEFMDKEGYGMAVDYPLTTNDLNYLKQKLTEFAEGLGLPVEFVESENERRQEK